MKQLEGRHPEDVEDFRVQLRTGRFVKAATTRSNAPCHRKRPGRDLAGERTIALVLESRPRTGERRRQVAIGRCSRRGARRTRRVAPARS